jgi:hypothetical protein
MRWWLAGIAAVLVLLSGALLQAQESGKLRAPESDGPPRVAPAWYEIHAQLDLAKAVIAGSWELEYRHTGKDTLRELVLNQPRWRSNRSGDSLSAMCRIDSLLVNGTPAENLLYSRDSATIRVPLRYPLPPDSAVFLLAAFRTRLALVRDLQVKPGEGIVVVTTWHPTIARCDHGKWLTGEKALRSGWVGEVGDYGVAVKVEGGVELVGAGELINGKLLYGMRPMSRNDTTYEYMARSDRGQETGFPGKADLNSERTYTWRVRGVRAFGLGIGRELGCDSWTRSRRVYDLWRPMRLDSTRLQQIRVGVDHAIRELGQNKEWEQSSFRIIVGRTVGITNLVDGMAVLVDERLVNEKKVSSSIMRQIRGWSEAVTRAAGR